MDERQTLITDGLRRLLRNLPEDFVPRNVADMLAQALYDSACKGDRMGSSIILERTGYTITPTQDCKTEREVARLAQETIERLEREPNTLLSFSGAQVIREAITEAFLKGCSGENQN